jgi:hypothetical protein
MPILARGVGGRLTAVAIGKVRQLTEAQWEQAFAVRDECKAASVCTDPADRPAAEAAIGRLYDLAGHEAPRFVWCQSPAAACVAVMVLSAGAGTWLPRGLGAGLGLEFRASASKSTLIGRVEESLDRSLAESLGRQLARSVRMFFQTKFAGPLEWRLGHALDGLLGEPPENLLRWAAGSR